MRHLEAVFFSIVILVAIIFAVVTNHFESTPNIVCVGKFIDLQLQNSTLTESAKMNVKTDQGNFIITGTSSFMRDKDVCVEAIRVSQIAILKPSNRSED